MSRPPEAYSIPELFLSENDSGEVKLGLQFFDKN
jgi:hypothetical protein